MKIIRSLTLVRQAEPRKKGDPASRQLCEAGRRQAAKLSSALGSSAFHLAVTSPWRQAIETAEIVAWPWNRAPIRSCSPLAGSSNHSYREACENLARLLPEASLEQYLATPTGIVLGFWAEECRQAIFRLAERDREFIGGDVLVVGPRLAVLALANSFPGVSDSSRYSRRLLMAELGRCGRIRLDFDRDDPTHYVTELAVWPDPGGRAAA